MGFIVNKGGAGLQVHRPVSGFHRDNSGNISVGNNTSVVPSCDTTIAEDGPFIENAGGHELINDGGWMAGFLSITLSDWAGTTHYRSIALGITGATPTTATIEGFMEGANENSLAVCRLHKCVAGDALAASIFQVSGSTRTIPADQMIKSMARIGDLTARGGRAFRNSAQAFTANVEAAISFSAADTDEEGFWSSGSPTRMTVPAGMAGWYMITAGACTPSSTPTNIGRRLALRLNGTTYLAYGLTNGDGGNKQNHVFALYYLAAGDYIESMFMSTTGVSLNNVNGPYGHITLLRVAKDDHPAACIKRANAQTIGINTDEVVQFDTVVRDNWGMSDIGGSNPERLTVPDDQGGWYIAVGNHRWAANTDNFNRMCSLHVNGNAVWVSRTSGLSNYSTQNEPCGSVGAAVKLAPGDYVTLQVWNKNTGATRNVNANEEFLSLVRVDL